MSIYCFSVIIHWFTLVKVVYTGWFKITPVSLKWHIHESILRRFFLWQNFVRSLVFELLKEVVNVWRVEYKRQARVARFTVRPKLPDLRRKQHATRSGGGNEDVSVSVRVSSALRLASDSRRGQDTIFCLLPTKLATKDGRRATLLASRYLNACDSVKCFSLIAFYITHIF